MNKIKFKSAKVKNFLSYGNVSQEILFPDGMNIIQGYNIDTGKSNGTGKSSVSEIIPFALFGKTIKDLPQTRIVNWSNRKGCVVKLYFDINDHEYTFIRTLKPNSFKVEQDGVEIIRPADIKSFQHQVEDEIIGMDFKTFKNLIYFSPNNTISILGAKKDEKRKFLESLFDLSEYSDMLKIANEKARSTNEKIDGLKSLIEKSQTASEMLQNELDSITPPDTKSITINLNKLNMVLDGLKSLDVDIVSEEELDDAKEQLQTLKNDQTSYDHDIDTFKSQIKLCQDIIDNTDINKPIKQKEVIDNKILEYKSSDHYNVDTSVIHDILTDIELEKSNIETVIHDNKSDIVEHEKSIELHNYIIKGNIDNISTIAGRKSNISGKDVCDFCGSECDHEKIKNHHDAQIQKYIEENDQYRVKIESSIKLKDELIEMNIQLSQQVKDLDDDKKRQNDILIESEKLVNNTKQLEEGLLLLPNITDLSNRINDNIVKIDEYRKKLNDITWKSDMNKEDIDSKKKSVDDLKVQKTKYDSHILRLDETTKKIDGETIRLNDFKVIIDDQNLRKDKNRNQIRQNDMDIDKWESEVKRLNLLLDHIDYLKVSLKDENVKQFAISSLLPFLNKQSNYYLSESGFPYSVVIDGWLDATIFGMGSDNVGYGSLSGGEGKAMDMALQLACNDIAELHARTTLGMAIYDELLDTSLDSDGVQRMMDIIRVKQRDTNNCVLVISHKDEIKEFDFDNSIMIEKENGFSTIQSQSIMV